MIVAKITLLILLAIVSYQDFKDRKVSLFLFPMLFIVSIIVLTDSVDMIDLAGRFGVNVLLILLNLALLTLYFSIKNKRPVNLMKHHLGYGDLLFFLVPCLLFSPLNYVFFTTASLLIILIGYVAVTFFWRKPIATIPLAGGQSILLFIVIFTNMIFDRINIFNEDIISPYWLSYAF